MYTNMASNFRYEKLQSYENEEREGHNTQKAISQRHKRFLIPGLLALIVLSNLCTWFVSQRQTRQAYVLSTEGPSTYGKHKYLVMGLLRC
jgi:hypothetical protein